MEIRETYSPEESCQIGEEIGRSLKGSEIICLNGDMGTGKTVLAQGIAKGLEIEEPVSSPTFTILQSYEGGRLPLYHFDVYRIEEPEEMEEIGYEDCFYGDGVTLVEWSDLIAELIPEHAIKIWIEKDPDKGDDYRRITIFRGDLGDSASDDTVEEEETYEF